MLRFYLDEDVPIPLARSLRRMGYDVHAEKELRNRRVSDPQQVFRAVDLGRAIITRNAKDFRTIHETLLLWSARWHVPNELWHHGILIIPHESVANLTRVVDEVANTLDTIDNRLVVWDARKGWHEPLRAARATLNDDPVIT